MTKVARPPDDSLALYPVLLNYQTIKLQSQPASATPPGKSISEVGWDIVMMHVVRFKPGGFKI